MTIDISDMICGPQSTISDRSDLKKIIEKITPQLNFKKFEFGHRFTYSANNQSRCFIMRSGVATLYRQPNDILIDVFEAPMLRGILPIQDSSHSSYVIKVITEAEIAILNKNDFYQLLSEHSLWENYAHHLESISMMVAEILFKLTSTTSVNLVFLQLVELMNKPASIREKISAEEYVRGKTRLSRSGVLRVLSELKTKGYLVTEKGILKEIKNIPTQF